MAKPLIRIERRKNGRPVAWFADAGGRVRTRAGANWLRTEQMYGLGAYGIELQLAQAAAGLGADGQAMPPLRGGYGRGYALAKMRFGGRPVRDLRGPGIGGHMLDQIRINYADDRRCSFALTTTLGRIKANANERRARWWGLSPASLGRLGARAEETARGAVAEAWAAEGFTPAGPVEVQRRFARRAA